MAHRLSILSNRTSGESNKRISDQWLCIWHVMADLVQIRLKRILGLFKVRTGAAIVVAAA